MTVPAWRLVRDGFRDPALNMAIDEALLISCEQGSGPPVLRLYGWSPPALSLGCFQKAAEEIDLEACRRRGIAVVRRPTGGKAIFHDRDLTYSVIAPTATASWGSDILETYRALSRALARGLRDLGVAVELLPAQKRALRAAAYRGACALVPASHEIVVQGKKLVGSAQKRLRRSFLQHGSIPVFTNYEANLELFRKGRPPGNPGRTLWREKTTALCEHLSPLPSRDEIEEAIAGGFREVLDIALEESSLSTKEKGRAQALVQRRYGREEWNLRGRASDPPETSMATADLIPPKPTAER